MGKPHHPRTNPKVRRAIAKALLELVEREGGRKAVSDRYGLPGSQISAIVNGGRAPRVETLILLSDALGRSVDSILGLS